MGSKDKNSAWAKARLAQALQLKEQLAPRVVGINRGRRTVQSTTIRTTTAAPAPAPGDKIDLAQIFWLDEKHKECVFGNASKYEYLEPNEDGTLEGVERHPRPVP
eukprot:4310126-Prymnesium_polylepis.1